MIDIVIDIETLGTRPGCPVIEIGACAVDPEGGAIAANFSRRVCCGYKFWEIRMLAETDAECTGMDKDTAVWWFADEERIETLRRIMANGSIPLRCALRQFADWFRDHAADREHTRIWANGPSFDIAILDRAYADAGIPHPWICRQERCVRTALELAGYEKGSVAWEEAGPRHRALNDARHEARKLWRSGALGTVSEVAKRLRQRWTAGKF